MNGGMWYAFIVITASTLGALFLIIGAGCLFWFVWLKDFVNQIGVKNRRPSTVRSAQPRFVDLLNGPAAIPDAVTVLPLAPTSPSLYPPAVERITTPIGENYPEIQTTHGQIGYPTTHIDYPSPHIDYQNPQLGYSNPQASYPNPQAGYPNPQIDYQQAQLGSPNPQSNSYLYNDQPQGYMNLVDESYTRRYVPHANHDAPPPPRYQSQPSIANSSQDYTYDLSDTAV